MYICLISITRNESASVKTLHNLLNINTMCMKNNVQIEINFCKDDPFEKIKMILKKIKFFDRIVFIEYGLGLDIPSVHRIIQPIENGWGGVIFPVVKEGVDWGMFTNKVKNKSTEPLKQMGLNFDTEVSTKISGEDNYKVVKTNPKCWMITSKIILKTMKGPKGSGISLPAQTDELFSKFLSKGIKLYAFVGAEITTTFQHECLGNILNMAHVHKELTPI